MQIHPNEPDPLPTDRLGSDLGALYRAQISIPPELDDAILSDARAQLSRRRSRQWVIRIGALITAAAAVIVVVVHFEMPVHSRQTSPMAMNSTEPKAQVDIIDALKLARRIRAGETNVSRDDVNHDGAVDQRDVDAIAMAAVRLQEGRVQ